MAGWHVLRTLRLAPVEAKDTQVQEVAEIAQEEPKEEEPKQDQPVVHTASPLGFWRRCFGAGSQVDAGSTKPLFPLQCESRFINPSWGGLKASFAWNWSTEVAMGIWRIHLDAP